MGRPLEAVFSKISSRTIAAASLGQVYRATLRDTGEDVAIKVVFHAVNCSCITDVYSSTLLGGKKKLRPAGPSCFHISAVADT